MFSRAFSEAPLLTEIVYLQAREANGYIRLPGIDSCTRLYILFLRGSIFLTCTID